MQAAHAPTTRRYNRKEIHTEDLPLAQKDDIELGTLGVKIVHGEALANIAGNLEHEKEYLKQLAFNEEPVTIIIEENSRSDFPETHVPVAVQGKNAEVFIDGKWLEMGWLPIGKEITTKRKYVEVLVRAKSDSIKTRHDDATVERPQNKVERRTSAAYPLTILHDANPIGPEWLTRLRMSH